MTAVRGSAAAVTGAASGIGSALALELASRGCDLALADRNEAGLMEIAAEVKKIGGRTVTIHRVDVTEPAQVQDFAKAAVTSHPGLNILINNAGAALIGNFDEINQEQMAWLMNTNFWGMVHTTRAFLPHLAQQPKAHIVNLSSIFGMIAPPGQTAYAATKFAVRGFSESLLHELASTGSPVRVSLVYPGGIATNIARNAPLGAAIASNMRKSEALEQFDHAARTTATAAAQCIIEGIEHDKARILIGSDAKVVDILQRLLPGRYWRALASIYNRRTRSGVNRR